MRKKKRPDVSGITERPEESEQETEQSEESQQQNTEDIDEEERPLSTKFLEKWKKSLSE